MEDLCPIGMGEVSNSDVYTDQQKRIQQETIEYCSNIKNSYNRDEERGKKFESQNIYKVKLDKNREVQKNQVKPILEGIKPRVYGIYIHPIFFIESDLSLDEKVFISYIMNYGAILESKDEDTTGKEFFFMSRERIIEELYWGMKMDLRKVSRMKSHLIEEGILIEKKPSKELVSNMYQVTGNSRCLWFSIKGYSDYITRFRENNPFLTDSEIEEEDNVEEKPESVITCDDKKEKSDVRTKNPNIKENNSNKIKEDPIKQRGISFTQFTQTPQQQIQNLEKQLKQHIIDGGKPSDPEYIKLNKEHMNLCKQHKRGKVIKRASKRQELIRDFMQKYGDKLDPKYETEGQIRTIIQDVKNTSDYAVKGLVEQFEWLDIFIKVNGIEEAQKLIQSHAYSGYAKLIYANEVPDQNVKTEAAVRRMEAIKNKYGNNEKNNHCLNSDVAVPCRENYKYWPCINSKGLDMVKNLFERAKDDLLLYEDTEPENSTIEFVTIVCNVYGKDGSRIIPYLIKEPNKQYYQSIRKRHELISLGCTIEDYMVKRTGNKYFGIYGKEDKSKEV